MKIKPQNLVYRFITIFLPWQYLNTYIDIEADSIKISRYFNINNKMKKDIVCFKMSDVKSIGYPKDLDIELQEDVLLSLGMYSGIYISQEIDFILKNNKIIPFNARPYKKTQIINFINLFPKDVIIGKSLSKDLKL